VTLAATCLKVLLIEDNAGDARLIQEMLRDAAGAHTPVELTHADASQLDWST
jgi:hypothetical protein